MAGGRPKTQQLGSGLNHRDTRPIGRDGILNRSVSGMNLVRNTENPTFLEPYQFIDTKYMIRYSEMEEK